MAEKLDPYYHWLSIAPEDQPPTLYRLLGLRPFENNPDVIEGAADRQMSHLRSLKRGEHASESQRLLKEVAHAKLALLNRYEKAEYDNLLREQMKGNASGRPEDEELSSTLANFLHQIKAEKPAVADKVKGTGRTAGYSAADQKARPPMLIVGLAVIAGILLILVIAILAFRSNNTPSGKPSQVAKTPKGDQQENPSESLLPTTEPTLKDQSSPATDDKPTKRKPEDKPLLPVPIPTPPEPEPPIPDPQTSPLKPEVKPPKPKHAMPSAEAQKNMVRQLEDVYKMSQTRSPAKTIQLARDLFELGKKSQGGPVEKFVLMREAMELSSRGGDAGLMVGIVDAISEEFEVDTLSVKHNVLGGFAARAPNTARIQSFMENANPVIDDALKAGRYQVALNLSQAAYHLSQQPQGRSYRQDVQRRHQEVQQVAQLWQRLQCARDTLKTNPNEPAANLAIGRWFCLEQGNWKRGLPHLAKCSNPILKDPAVQELTGPKNPDDQVKLGDAWWGLAEQTTGTEKDSLMLHAAEWYSKAEPQLPAGFAKAKVGKRLEEAEKIERPASERKHWQQQVEPLLVDLDRGAVRVTLPLESIPQRETLRLEIAKLEGGFPEPVFTPSNTIKPGEKTTIRFDAKEFPNFWLQIDFDVRTRPSVGVTGVIDYRLATLPTPRKFVANEASQVMQNLLMEQRQLQVALEQTPPNDKRKKGEINEKITAIKNKIDNLKKLHELYAKIKGQQGKIHFRVYTVANGKELTLMQSYQSTATGKPTEKP